VQANNTRARCCLILKSWSCPLIWKSNSIMGRRYICVPRSGSASLGQPSASSEVARDGLPVLVSYRSARSSRRPLMKGSAFSARSRICRARLELKSSSMKIPRGAEKSCRFEPPAIIVDRILSLIHRLYTGRLIHLTRGGLSTFLPKACGGACYAGGKFGRISAPR
jgi:hypothetical protein